jgi:hypothetical protein
MADEGATYLCGIFESVVVLGRISSMNLPRAEELVERLPGPEGEELDRWASGTREELLATFPELLGAWAFDDADESYRLNPQHQVQFDRPDR